MEAVLLAASAPTLGMILGTPAFANEGDESAMTMEVPASVTKAASANTMGIELTGVAVDDGVHEFAGAGADGMGHEVDVMGDCSIGAVEMQIMMDALPAKVSAALEAKMAGFTPDYMEEPTCPNGVIHKLKGTHEDAAGDAEINATGDVPATRSSGQPCPPNDRGC